MNFKEAKLRMKELAKGKYHSVRYEVTELEDGELRQRCEVYIVDCDLHAGRTWKEAFTSLAEEMMEDVEELEETK